MGRGQAEDRGPDVSGARDEWGPGGRGGGDRHELCLPQMKKLARRHQQQQEQQNSQRLGQGEAGPGPGAPA